MRLSFIVIFILGAFTIKAQEVPALKSKKDSSSATSSKPELNMANKKEKKGESVKGSSNSPKEPKASLGVPN
jgi:hypothetical protein